MEKKYNSLSEFKIDYPTEYRFLKKTKQIERLCKDVGWVFYSSKPSNYWTKERCLKEVLKHDGKYSWFINSFGSYKAAKKNGWFDECISRFGKSKRKMKIKK